MTICRSVWFCGGVVCGNDWLVVVWCVVMIGWRWLSVESILTENEIIDA